MGLLCTHRWIIVVVGCLKELRREIHCFFTKESREMKEFWAVSPSLRVFKGCRSSILQMSNKQMPPFQKSRQLSFIILRKRVTQRMQTRDESLLMKPPWQKCSNRWDERLWGSVTKTALGESKRKKTTTLRSVSGLLASSEMCCSRC